MLSLKKIGLFIVVVFLCYLVNVRLILYLWKIIVFTRSVSNTKDTRGGGALLSSLSILISFPSATKANAAAAHRSADKLVNSLCDVSASLLKIEYLWCMMWCVFVCIWCEEKQVTRVDLPPEIFIEYSSIHSCEPFVSDRHTIHNLTKNSVFCVFIHKTPQTLYHIYIYHAWYTHIVHTLWVCW